MNEKGTILVVDDDLPIRESLRRILMKQGYAAETANTAEQALIMLQEKAFDLVLTDLRMPGMDGLELLGQIKERSPHTPVIMLTAYASTDTVIQALRHGVNDFLTKPFRPNELLNIIQRELSRYKQTEPAGTSSGLGRQLSRPQLDRIDRLLAELRAEVTARCVILVESNGHMISTKGIIENLNVSALSALVAGDFAATSTIASLIGEGDSFQLNYHEGKRYSAYSAKVAPDVFLLVVFGQDIRLGTVLFYTRKTLAQLEELFAQVTSAPKAPAQEAITPDVATPSETFSLEEILNSGLLDEDALTELDSQFADLWTADTAT